MLHVMYDSPWLTFFLFWLVASLISKITIVIINRSKPHIQCSCCSSNEHDKDE